MIKGFLIDDEKLKGTKSNYFDELYDRVKSIRTSEKNFWQKIKDILAFGSIDFEPDSEIAKTFFATVQNMFHYAIDEHTAQELIKERADGHKENMGLNAWSGNEITKHDTTIAKNYFISSILGLLVAPEIRKVVAGLFDPDLPILHQVYL